MTNIINAVLNDKFAVTASAWQWDYGQILRVQSKKNLPKAVEFHFSLQESGGDSVTRIGTTKDGVTDVPIPDSLLENNGTSNKYNIYAFIYIEDGTSGNTEYRIEIPVKSRPKPEVPGSTEEPELFRETVKAVNDAADRAETAEQNSEQYADDASKASISASESAEKAKNDRTVIEELKEDFKSKSGKALENATIAKKEAESWAHGHVDYPDRNEDNAMYYAEATKQVATNNGFCRLEINDAGHLILDRTDNIKDSLNFRLNEKGHMEVVMG